MPHRRHRIRVETERHVVEGVVQLPSEGFRSRTTDFFNAHDSDFVALTDATLRPVGAGEPEHHDYIAVSARHIVLVVELEVLDPAPAGPVAGIGVAAPVAP